MTPIAPDRHNKGWPRFSLTVQTASSDQTHRIYVHCQGRIDSHDARGAGWEGVQYRPLKGEGEFGASNSTPRRSRNVSGPTKL